MRGEVPAGWQETRFENIASVGRGLTYSNKQECLPDSDDAVCVLRIPNVQEQRFDPTSLKYINGVTPKQVEKYSVPRQAILMVGSNGNAARVGNCCFVDSAEPYLFASFLMRVVPDQRQADSKFFYYLIAGGSVQDAITESVEGSTGLKNISLTILRQQRLLLPPLPEQRKIAAILSSVDEAIAATEAVIAQTRRVKEGLLQDLLTRGIGRGGRPHTRFKQTEIGEIPESWEVRRLEDVCREKITYGIVQCGPRLDEGIPYIRVSDMEPPELDVNGMLRTAPEIAAKFSRSRVEEGDLVYALRGKIGEVRIIRADVAGANLTQGTARLAPRADLDAEYLLWAMRSPETLRQGDLEAKGSTFREITLARLRKIRVPVPPADEQKGIVERLNTADQAERCHAASLDSLRQTKSGLLQDLLTGKVRVSA